MSDPSSSGTENTGPAKKPVSAVRNVIGLVALIAVLTVGGFEYSAKMGYSSAVNALNARMDNENADLMSPAEAERLIGKPSDDAGSKVEENRQTFTKQTYTWRGPLKSYTLTAYYTQGMGAGMHHFETPDQKYTPDAVAAPAVVRAPGRGRAKTGAMQPATKESKDANVQATTEPKDSKDATDSKAPQAAAAESKDSKDATDSKAAQTPPEPKDSKDSTDSKAP